MHMHTICAVINGSINEGLGHVCLGFVSKFVSDYHLKQYSTLEINHIFK